MTTQQQPVDLTLQQLKLLRAIEARIPGGGLQEVVRQIIDEHQGPFEYSGRPEYLVGRDDVPLAFWEALTELKRLHLSSGPLPYERADGRKIEAQQVDPLLMEEILEALLLLLKMLLGRGSESVGEVAVSPVHREYEPAGPAWE